MTEVMECCAVYDGGGCATCPGFTFHRGKNHYNDRFLPGIGPGCFAVSGGRAPIGGEAANEDAVAA